METHVDKILKEYGNDPGRLEVILKALLEKEGRLRASDIVRVAEALRIPVGDAFTLASPLLMRALRIY